MFTSRATRAFCLQDVPGLTAEYQSRPFGIQARAQSRFEGTTTNQSDYRAHALSPREHYGPRHEARPDLPFDGTTTSKVLPPIAAFTAGLSVGAVMTLERNEAVVNWLWLQVRCLRHRYRARHLLQPVI